MNTATFRNLNFSFPLNTHLNGEKLRRMTIVHKFAFFLAIALVFFGICIIPTSAESLEISSADMDLTYIDSDSASIHVSWSLSTSGITWGGEPFSHYPYYKATFGMYKGGHYYSYCNEQFTSNTEDYTFNYDSLSPGTYTNVRLIIKTYQFNEPVGLSDAYYFNDIVWTGTPPLVLTLNTDTEKCKYFTGSATLNGGDGDDIYWSWAVLTNSDEIVPGTTGQETTDSNTLEKSFSLPAGNYKWSVVATDNGNEKSNKTVFSVNACIGPGATYTQPIPGPRPGETFDPSPWVTYKPDDPRPWPNVTNPLPTISPDDWGNLTDPITNISDWIDENLPNDLTEIYNPPDQEDLINIVNSSIINDQILYDVFGFWNTILEPFLIVIEIITKLISLPFNLGTNIISTLTLALTGIFDIIIEAFTVFIWAMAWFISIIPTALCYIITAFLGLLCIIKWVSI